MQHGASRRTALVIGAQGFLGGYIVAALQRCGWHVLKGVRSPHVDSVDERRCDLAAMGAPCDWHEALTGVDAVVNAAGILRETGVQTFEAIHVKGPLALAHACIQRGVRRFVQISALGNPMDGEFIASKHRCDSELLAMPIRAVVLRPSVVYATEGSYGGTSLLRALAALPFGTWLPGDGTWPLQPVAVWDLANLVVRAVESDHPGMFEVGGPSVTLRGYQEQWRSWLHIPGGHVVRVPLWLVSIQVSVAERFGRGPMSTTVWRMLKRGNVTSRDARARLVATFGCAPRALHEVLALRPSQVQDRWHARLYFMRPLLCASVVVLWLISGLSGLFSAPAEIGSLAIARLPHAVELARIAGGVDVALSIWLATGWQMRWAITAMLASVVVYTIAFSVWSPTVWIAPLGGLAKNLVVLPALAVLWVLGDRR